MVALRLVVAVVVEQAELEVAVKVVALKAVGAGEQQQIRRLMVKIIVVQ